MANPEVNKPLSPTAAAAAGEPSDGPTVTLHQQRAQAFVAGIDALVAELPAVEKVPPTTARGHRTVPIVFAESVVAMTEQNSQVRAATVLDTAATVNRLQLFAAYRPVLDRAVKFVKELAALLNATKAAIAADTLDAYSAVKRLANRTGVDQHAFKVMERDLGRKRKAKDPEAEVPQTQAPGTTPPATTTTPATSSTTTTHK